MFKKAHNFIKETSPYFPILAIMGTAMTYYFALVSPIVKYIGKPLTIIYSILIFIFLLLLVFLFVLKIIEKHKNRASKNGIINLNDVPETYIDVIVENSSLKTYTNGSKRNMYKMECLVVDNASKQPLSNPFFTIVFFMFNIPLYKACFKVEPLGNYKNLEFTEGIRDTKYFMMRAHNLNKYNGYTYRITFCSRNKK